MPRLALIQKPCFIVNNDFAQSLTDTQWYIGKRGLPTNYLAFNFGSSGNGALGGGTNSDAYYTGSSGTITCQAAVINGASVFVSGSYSGNSMHTAWQKFATASGCDSVICSTHTPHLFQVAVDNPTYQANLPAYMGSDVSPPLPTGRLGCPNTVSTGFQSPAWGNQTGTNQGELPSKANSYTLVSDSGVSVSPMLYQCVTRAIAAEAINNLSKNHWASSTLSYTPYITTANNSAILAWLQAQGFSTIDLNGSTTSATSVNSINFFGGSVTNPPGLFALCIGSSLFNTSGTAPGSEGFSSNYSTLPGAWCYTWNSFNAHLGYDLLYNGGSAAICSAGEPSGAGLVDPLGVLLPLVAQQAQIIYASGYCSLSSISLGSGTYPANPGAYGALFEGFNFTSIPTTPVFTAKPRLTVIGDPLYRPYKNTFAADWGKQNTFITGMPICVS
jgi:hypothetical protein